MRTRARLCVRAWKLWHPLLLLLRTVKIWILGYRKLCIIFTSIPCSFSLNCEQTSICAHWTRFMYQLSVYCDSVPPSVCGMPATIRSRIFHLTVYNLRIYRLKYYYFTCCFISVWNLVSYIKGKEPRMFGNRVLREMFGRKRKEQQTGKTRSFRICTPHQVLVRWSNHRGWDGRGLWHIRLRTERHGGSW